MSSLDRRSATNPAAGMAAAARRDPLTRLGNRLALSEDLAALDGRTRRYGRSYCIALCGLSASGTSWFQMHLAGDLVLRSAGRALRHECRGADFAYRAGGDEFVVVLPDRTLDSARAVLERMRHAVEALAAPGGGDASAGGITMSAGVATVASARFASCHEVLAEARAALRHADAHGRGCTVIGTDVTPRASDGVQAALAVPSARSARQDQRRPGAPDRRVASRPPGGLQPAPHGGLASVPPASRPLGDPRSVA